MGDFLQKYMYSLVEFVYPAWIDVLWVIPVLWIARPKQRVLSALFMLSSMVMMRMQADMMGWIGFPNGLIGLMPYHVFMRGLVIYSIIYLVFILFLRFAPGSRGSLLLATTLTLFFAAFFASSLIMVL